MKIKNSFSILFFGVLMSACIADEPLAIECDIETIEVKVPGAKDIFKVGTGEQTTDGWRLDLNDRLKDTEIVFTVNEGVEVGSYPTYIRATKGAKVYLVDPNNKSLMTQFQYDALDPANPKDDVHYLQIDYSNSEENPIELHVHSESFDMTEKQWERIYYIKFQHDVSVDIQTTRFVMEYTFDGNYDLDKTRSYFEWTETNPEILPLFQTGDAVWRNGNPGYKLSKSSAPAEDYPTVAAKGMGPEGSDCVKLETKSTGSFGAMVNMPIAAGSLFNGVFDVTNALKNARLATKFGVPFRYLPVKLEADLRMEDMNVVEGTFMDEPDLYCVLYDNEGGTYMLNGNDVLSSDKIVAIARLKHFYDEADPRKDKTTMSPEHGVISEWKHFELYLDYDPFNRNKEKPDTLIDSNPSKHVDLNKLANYGYSVVIGASSSWQGAHFKASEGSKLYLDNIKLTCYNPYEASGGGDSEPEPEQTEFDGTAVMDFNYEPTLVERTYNNQDLRYYDWTETDRNLTLSLFSQYPTWASTNENYMVYRNGAPLEEYPVQPAQESGAIALTTIHNGVAGTMVGSHRTPGMIYTGIVNLNDETATTFVQRPFQEMKLGVPFLWKPTEIEATVKYKSGPEYRDAGNKLVDQQDHPEIFCVVYRNTDEQGNPYTLSADRLYDALNTPEESVLQELQVVGRAKMQHPTTLSETDFTPIPLSMHYPQNVTEEEFASGQYSVVVGAMSSYRSMLMEGAEGSCLTIDKIVLRTKK